MKYLFFITLLIISLTGCDSNSDGSAKGPTGPVPVYTGSTEDLLLTKENAVDVSKTVLYPLDLAELAKGFWIPTLVTETQSVKGRTGGKLTVSQSSTNENQLIFDGYTEQGITFDGRILNRGPWSESMWGFGGTIVFDRFEISSPDTNLMYHGEVSVSDYNSLNMNLLIEDMDTGLQIKFIDILLSTIIDESNSSTFQPTQTLTRIEGEIFDSVEGRWQLISVRPYRNFRANDTFWRASAGGRTLIRASEQQVAFDSISTNFVNVVFAPGTKEESFLRLPWSTMNDLESDEESALTTGLIANPGVTYTSASVGRPVELRAGFSHNALDQYMTASWQLIHRPLFSTATSKQLWGVNPTFVPDVEGIYLFKLTVEDEVGNKSFAHRELSVSNSLSDEEYIAFFFRGSPELQFLDENTILVDSLSAVTARYEIEETEVDVSKEDVPSWTFAETYTVGPTKYSAQVDLPGMGRYLIRAGNQSLYYFNGINNFEMRAELVDDGDMPFRCNEAIAVDYNNDSVLDLVARCLIGDQYSLVAVLAKGLANHEVIIIASDVSYTDTYLLVEDLNSDGFPDIIQSTEFGVEVNFRALDGELLPSVNVVLDVGECTSRRFSNLKLGDYDGDNLKDIFVRNPCDGEVYIWTQEDDGAFASPISLSFEGVGNVSFDLGFVDGDNRIDFLFPPKSNVSGLRYTIALNKSDGFQMRPKLDDGTRPSSEFTVRFIDFTGDGKLEVFFSNYNDIEIFSDLLGEDGGQLISNSKLDLESRVSFRQSMALSMGDIDGDGDQDMVAYSSRDLFVLKQDGGEFKPFYIDFFNADLYPMNVAVLDYNQDGNVDIVVQSDRGLHIRFGGIHAWSTSE